MSTPVKDVPLSPIEMSQFWGRADHVLTSFLLGDLRGGPGAKPRSPSGLW